MVGCPKEKLRSAPALPAPLKSWTSQVLDLLSLELGQTIESDCHNLRLLDPSASRPSTQPAQGGQPRRPLPEEVSGWAENRLLSASAVLGFRGRVQLTEAVLVGSAARIGVCRLVAASPCLSFAAAQIGAQRLCQALLPCFRLPLRPAFLKGWPAADLWRICHDFSFASLLRQGQGDPAASSGRRRPKRRGADRTERASPGGQKEPCTLPTQVAHRAPSREGAVAEGLSRRQFHEPPAIVARRCRSSGVEHSLGKGEVECSNHSGSTTKPQYVSVG